MITYLLVGGHQLEDWNAVEYDDCEEIPAGNMELQTIVLG